MMVCAVAALALPSAVLAFSTRFDMPGKDLASRNEIAGVSPAAMTSRLAHSLSPASGTPGRGLFPFTPAGLATRIDRSVTVAIRVNEAAARTIIVRGIPPQASNAKAAASHLAPTINVSLARGLGGFSLPTPPGTSTYRLPPDPRRIDGPDLSAFAANDHGGPAESRLSPRLLVDERERPGRAPRTLEGVGEQTVDLGGSYRVTRNFDVTAGLRYQQDRDRLKPTYDGKANDQSVFVGTQFRF
ncbi:hypothetical protein GTZ99_13995 [Novosphingobium sp. FSY-8]|uniref:Uncharacterized protein n=1 Tax=Novosphingobium ovatum TaxID=1908523 RepID=A0ABW9XGI1_9SPHN|nr:hypothetical protein [Novosphingobium ovatum]NBC37663.1 hypothetical protein [Novosphingobium ovatum]